jgi:hypothetical protein
LAGKRVDCASMDFSFINEVQFRAHDHYRDALYFEKDFRGVKRRSLWNIVTVCEPFIRYIC